MTQGRRKSAISRSPYFQLAFDTWERILRGFIFRPNRDRAPSSFAVWTCAGRTHARRRARGRSRRRVPELKKTERLPGRPFAFLAFLFNSHFRLQFAAMMVVIILATFIEALGPLLFGKHRQRCCQGRRPGPFRLAARSRGAMVRGDRRDLAVRLGALSSVRGDRSQHDARACARSRRSYLFGYLLGHSRAISRKTSPASSARRSRQAGQATVSPALRSWCFDARAHRSLMLVGGTLLYLQHPAYAVVLVDLDGVLSHHRRRFWRGAA